MKNNGLELHNAEDMTRLWIERTVVGLNLCPFAKAPLDMNLIRITALPVQNFDDLITAFEVEKKLLERSLPSKISNSFLVFPQLQVDFEEFFEMAATLEEIYQLQSLRGPTQLVVFHPQFRFSNSAQEDKANLVNASPCPSLHLLRRDEVSAALKNFQLGISIAHQNKVKITSLSEEEIRFHWWFLSK
jgi:hypothetical protein